MENRKIFDTIPEKFDKWRPRYCKEAFDFIIGLTGLDGSKSMLEIGPGTGQATEPFLRTGCDYLAIELGEHLYEYTKRKFSGYGNFGIVNGDFGLYDFGERKFDVIMSAATIQWIPEQVAFPTSYNLLRSGGYLVMMLMRGDYRTPDEALYGDIQKVYDEYFNTPMPYRQKFGYTNAVDYGFTDVREFDFYGNREYSADDYIEYIGTHSDHIALREPDRSKFFDGIHSAIIRHGGIIRFDDTVVVYITRKP